MKTRKNAGLFVVGVVTAVVPSTILFVGVNMLFAVPLVIGTACALAGLRQTNQQRAHTAIGVLACVVATLGPLLLTAFLNRSGEPVLFILPAGYRGEFSIVKDHVRGVPLVYRDGSVVFRIPSGGKLIVRDDSPLFDWHEEHFTFADGQPARVEGGRTEPGSIMEGNGTRGSTEYDGTTHTWRVLGHPN